MGAQPQQITQTDKWSRSSFVCIFLEQWVRPHSFGKMADWNVTARKGNKGAIADGLHFANIISLHSMQYINSTIEDIYSAY